MPRLPQSAGSLSEELDRVAPEVERRAPPDELAQRLAELADALLEHAGALRRRYEELDLMLSDVGEDRSGAFLADGGGGGDGTPSERQGRESLEFPTEAESEAEDEGARLLSLDLALKGTPREEAAEYLRATFGLERDDILDEAYGRAGVPGPHSRSGPARRRPRRLP